MLLTPDQRAALKQALAIPLPPRAQARRAEFQRIVWALQLCGVTPTVPGMASYLLAADDRMRAAVKESLTVQAAELS